MKTRFSFVLTFICWIFFGSFAYAVEINITELKAEAEKGNAEAQYKMGYCCCVGQGVIKDMNEAVKWFRRAADQGDGDAQTSLGRCYHEGTGLIKDDNEAVKPEFRS